jgi:DNA-binding transcriptional MocR family regulator
MVLATEASILCPSAFSQRVVTRYLSSCPWQEQIKVFRELYRERRDAMLDTLTTQMPEGVTWTKPAGGFYVWLTLPDGLDSKVMLPQAIGDRVAYVPGTAFYADGSGAAHMRLSYCYPTPERIRDGVSRLGGVIRGQVELLETFGPTSGRPQARRGPTADQR